MEDEHSGRCSRHQSTSTVYSGAEQTIEGGDPPRSNTASYHAEPSAAAAAREGHQSANSGHGGNELQAMALPALMFAKRFIPIALLLAIKLLFEHRIGILLSLGMYLIFVYTDKSVREMVRRRYVTLFQRLTGTMCLWLILSGSTLSVYWVFAEQKIERCLILLEPAEGLLNEFWSTLFVCVVTDFMLMYFSVFAKTVIISLIPTCSRRRGNVFELLEYFALVYRELPSAACWLRYILNLNADLFVVCLVVIYIIMKLERLYVRSRELLGCLDRLRSSSAYGFPPNHNEINECGGICPICHDDFSQPIKLLRCSHLFCNECIATWFDRERSCPMCRTSIVEKVDWRDGSTCGRVHAW